jgi:signal transduction histidine kinase
LAFGEHSAALVVAQDITLRKQAERALQAKNEELKGMSAQLWQTAKLATMGELAASIAHELNNPLTTVNLHLEHLLGQMSPENLMRGALQVMAQELERMSTLVANLLAFSRRSQPQISTVDMGEEIDTTLELIHYHLRNHRIHVERHYPSERPNIQADRQQLRQLFLNLFTNAIDAMPQGGTLTISMRAEEAVTPSHVVIEIVDTGFGMASEEIPKALEPFYTTKSEGKGTGLGLPICRRIIEEHHGTLRITSDRGKGTTVQIAFPIANAANAAFLRAP